MNKSLLIIIAALIVIAFESCDFEDKYVHLCDGKYGSDQVIDSLERRYGLNNAFDFGQWRKEKFAPRNPSCDTIKLQIQGDSLPFHYNDTFAISVAKIFFGDSMNSKVKCLTIKLIDYWPRIGKVEENYLINKSALQFTYSSQLPINTDNFEYQIVEQYIGQTNGRIGVKIKQDYQNIKELAARLRQKFDTTIKQANLTAFDINIIVESLDCKLCLSKRYHFFYVKENGNI